KEGDLGVYGPFREGGEKKYKSLQDVGDWLVFPIGDNSFFPERWAQTYANLLGRFEKSNGRIGVDFMGFRTFQELSKLIPRCELVDSFGALLSERAVKSGEEIKALSSAANIVDEGIAAARKHVAPGRRENQIYARVAATMIEFGSEG